MMTCLERTSLKLEAKAKKMSEVELPEIEEIRAEWDALHVPASGEYGETERVELIKEKSWDFFNRALKINRSRYAAFFLLHGIITCHYWMARRTIESMKTERAILRKIRGKKYEDGYILDIDHYTRHWLWANGDRSDLFPKEVIDIIREEYYYEPEENKYLPKNASIYQGEGI